MPEKVGADVEILRAAACGRPPGGRLRWPPMQPLAVDVLLLRAAAPDLPLTVGRTLVARVLERGLRGVGILNLAGAIVTAELPASVRAGDRLRLVVREAT